HLAAVSSKPCLDVALQSLAQSLSQRERARRALPLWGRDRERAASARFLRAGDDLAEISRPVGKTASTAG
ncbi:MAG TPA: hypothetical protein VF775_00340, partial [Geobacteraceae bacterium]